MLTDIAILAIKGLGADMVEELRVVLGVSTPTMYRYIKDNSPELTQSAAIDIIQERTGLTIDMIIKQ